MWRTTTKWWPPTTSRPDFPPGSTMEALVEVMGRDKKVTGGGLTFVLDGPDGLEVVARRAG